MIDVNDPEARCGNCRFWFTAYTLPGELGHDPDEEHRIGQCRINPPSCARDNEGVTWEEGIWPQVGYRDNCAHFSLCDPAFLRKHPPVPEVPLLVERTEPEVKTQSE